MCDLFKNNKKVYKLVRVTLKSVSSAADFFWVTNSSLLILVDAFYQRRSHSEIGSGERASLYLEGEVFLVISASERRVSLVDTLRLEVDTSSKKSNRLPRWATA